MAWDGDTSAQDPAALNVSTVKFLDEITDHIGTRTEPECPSSLVPEDTGELGGLTDRCEVVMPGAMRTAAVDHPARGRGLDAGKGGTGFEGLGRGVHGRTMRPVEPGVESARKSRKTRNLRMKVVDRILRCSTCNSRMRPMWDTFASNGDSFVGTVRAGSYAENWVTVA